MSPSSRSNRSTPVLPAVVIRRVTVEEILALRRDELRPGVALDAARFPDDDNPETRHFGAFGRASGQNVGCASFMPNPFEGAPAFQLRGMATRADVARRGIGAKLLGAALGSFPAGTRFWCNARLVAVPFYRRMGWAVVSGEFEIPTVGPHVTMVRQHLGEPL